MLHLQSVHGVRGGLPRIGSMIPLSFAFEICCVLTALPVSLHNEHLHRTAPLGRHGSSWLALAPRLSFACALTLALTPGVPSDVFDALSDVRGFLALLVLFHMINPHVHGLTRHFEMDVADQLPFHLGVRCVPLCVHLQVCGQIWRRHFRLDGFRGCFVQQSLLQ